MTSSQVHLIRTPWVLIPALLLLLPAGTHLSRSLADESPVPEAGNQQEEARAESDRSKGRSDRQSPLTWESLEDRLTAAEREGFNGSVLVVREGKVVLDRGYGFADPDRKIRNRPDTIYAIGSTPIDFTRAGTLLLAQKGKLSTGDTLAKFFKAVPEDKAAITIHQLMTGRSGLRDFLGRPGDPNPDHHWIDRDEAMRRIFEDELLFQPGTQRRHSHAAWGVLAAIIELVSGQSYPQFTSENLFEPAGMKDMGFFGVPYPAERMAVGQSPTTNGEINAPPYWGPTSWLVMGSGGQVSTTRDMLHWHQAMASGKILSPEFEKLYWDPPGSLLNGGDMFGFEIIYTQGPDSLFILVSNAGGVPGGVRKINALGRELASLVVISQRRTRAGGAPAYSLGVQLAIEIEAEESDIRILVDSVIEGGAAERDGLREGDKILSANGRPLGDDPLKVLDPFLATGEVIRFEIIRDGSRRIVPVTPAPR